MNIVIMDGYASNPGDLNWDALKQLGHVTVYPRTSDAEKVERAKDADIILINKVQMDAETLDQLPRLKYIGVQATGFNVVDIKAAKERGIVVTNIPAYSTESVAQMTFALILSITNRVEHYTKENRNGRWANNPDFCYWDTPLIELAGKQMGIVGLGNIGMKVATIAHSMGMNVCSYTSLLKHFVELLLHLFPDGITVWFDNHTATHWRKLSEVGLHYQVIVPLTIIISTLGQIL